MNKFFLTIVAIAVIGSPVVMANDAIPIINTVFYGLNTLVNLTREPTVVVSQPTTVVVHQPPVVGTPVVVSLPPATVVVNSTPTVVSSGTWIPLLDPPPPPPLVIRGGREHVRRPPPPPPRGHRSIPRPIHHSGGRGGR